MKKIGLIIGLVLCLLSVFGEVVHASGVFLEAAPTSRAFIKYRQAAARGAVARSSGYRPSPLDLTHLKGADYSGYLSSSARGAADVPVSYDLRQLGLVTGVKDQGELNACWAFSSIGSIESTYLKRNPASALDLSEMFLFWYAFNDIFGLTPLGPGKTPGGGFDNSAVSTFARWTGPVLEDSAPLGNIPTGLAQSYPMRLHLQDAFFLNLEFDDEKSAIQPTNDIRKRLLMDYGAISVGCKAPTGSGYNAQLHSWNSTSKVFPDHSVLLVGWDDNYPKENFNVRPSSDGAWLVKNSWGVEWGDSGYYWISYEDRVFSDGVAYLAEETDNYDLNYGYDELGWCGSVNIGRSSSPWMANVFAAASDGEELKAVSFYTTAPNTAYELYIYNDVPQGGSPVLGTEVLRQSGVESFAGYHTVRLNSSVPLRKDSRFSVVLRMTSAYSYPLAVETKIVDFSDSASSGRGESYFSADGKSWSDAYDVASAVVDNASLNACVRAFTSINRSIPALSAFSDDPKEWGALIIDLGNLVHVRLNAKIISSVIPSGINVQTGGLNNVRVLIGDSEGYPVENTQDADLKDGTSVNRYLVIEGTAASEADALNAVIESVTYTLGGLVITQFSDNPIMVSDMTPMDIAQNSGDGGGGGGCDLGAGSLLPLITFSVSVVLLSRRKKYK
ncbi:MAG: lectin like domain-containing protein [Synergistaceae bacterium]|jgi:C1A family cysteine protease|nr:lectin like domain-containing protein [Synergistaceae bacterium]